MGVKEKRGKKTQPSFEEILSHFPAPIIMFGRATHFNPLSHVPIGSIPRIALAVHSSPSC